MKSFLLVLLIFTGTVISVDAQDIIIKKDGSEIRAKVTEVHPDTVKYKMFDDRDGLVYALQKSEIFMIKYDNGQKEVFGITATPATGTATDSSAPAVKADQKKIQKAAIEFAKSINFNIDTVLPTEKPVFIWLKGTNIRSENRVIQYTERGAIVGSGIPIFNVYASSRQTESSQKVTAPNDSSSIAAPLLFVPEEGKYYVSYWKRVKEDIKNLKDLMYKNPWTLEIFVEEIIDAKMLELAKKDMEKWLPKYEEKREEQIKKFQDKKEYLAFSKENPAYLEGVWQHTITPKTVPLLKNLTPKTKAYITLTFNGNKVILHKTFSLEKPVHYEGTFSFNKETINVVFSGYKVFNTKQVWYYEMKDGVLNILSAPTDISISGSVKGEYQKME